MNSDIVELNLKLLLENNEINKIKEYYDLELELFLELIDKLVSFDKVEFINTNYLRYRLDEKFKKNLDTYDFEAPLKTKEVLGKYFEEMEKSKRKQSYKLKKEMEHENKVAALKCDKAEVDESTIKGCYINDQLIGFIKFTVHDNVIKITDFYSKIKGEGIGSKLLNSLDKSKDIAIDVLTNNSSKLMFEKLGFEYEMRDDEKIVYDNKYTMIKKALKKEKNIIKKG